MKIAFIGQKGIPAHSGGVEKHVDRIAVSMAEMGHEVTVYARPHYVKSTGYGYAKRSKAQQEKIGKQLSWFVSEPTVPVRYFVLIIDAEIGLKDSDRETYALLTSAGHRIVIVANKSDKGRRSDVMKHVAALKIEFPDSEIIRYSAKTGEGNDALIGLLLAD